MGLNQTKFGNLEKDVGSRSPFLYMLHLDSDLRHATFKGGQCGTPRLDVVVCKAQSADQTVYDIQCDRNIYVNARVQSGGGQMHHYGDYESEEGD